MSKEKRSLKVYLKMNELNAEIEMLHTLKTDSVIDNIILKCSLGKIKIKDQKTIKKMIDSIEYDIRNRRDWLVDAREAIDKNKKN